MDDHLSRELMAVRSTSDEVVRERWRVSNLHDAH